jgi:toxin ParE1/3/4
MAKLIWSPKSLKDLELIFEFIEMDSREYARIFINKIVEIAKSIPDFPLAGRIVPEYQEGDIREKIYKSYRIIYRIRVDEIIEVVTVFHQAQILTEEKLQ